MIKDIQFAKLLITKGSDVLSPVYADFTVSLSDSFDSPTIFVNFNNFSDANSRDREAEQQWITLRRSAETGIYTARVKLSPYSPSATYQFKGLQAKDKAGNDINIGENDFIRLGLSETKFTFTNPVSDDTAPIITKYSFGQWTKTGSDDLAIDVQISMKDILSGIGYTNNRSMGEGETVDYNNPTNGRSFAIFLNGPSDFSGTATFNETPNENGEYTGSGQIIFNKYAPSGTYTLQARVPDRAGNTYWSNRSTDGNPISINFNNPNEDTATPSLSDLNISGTFDALTGRPLINLTGKLTDYRSGFQLAQFNLNGPDGGMSSASFDWRNQGPNGEFDINIALPIPFKNGQYVVSGIATDNARNSIWWDKLQELLIIAPSESNPNGSIVTGSYSDDFIFGSSGADLIDAAEGNDNVFGGAGADQIEGDSGNDNLLGGAGDDLIKGGKGNDKLYSGDGNDNVYGDDGDDLIVGGDGKGDDNYNGGAGSDTVIYKSSASNPVNVNLRTGRAYGNEIGSDILNGIENIVGGQADDMLTGSIDNNRIDGIAGTDTVIFQGDRSDYNPILNDQSDLVVQDTRADRDGSDTLLNIEYIQFADQKVAFSDLKSAAFLVRQKQGGSSATQPETSGVVDESLVRTTSGTPTQRGGAQITRNTSKKPATPAKKPAPAASKPKAIAPAKKATTPAAVKKTVLAAKKPVPGAGKSSITKAGVPTAKKAAAATPVKKATPAKSPASSSGIKQAPKGKAGNVAAKLQRIDQFSTTSNLAKDNKYDSLINSTLAKTDKITGFLIGKDVLDAPYAVAADLLHHLSAVSDLTEFSIQQILKPEAFVAYGASTFTYGNGGSVRTFVAMNDANAGFDTTKDRLVEITGYSGNLKNLSVV